MTPADLACYAYAMVNRQDASYSPGSPEIGRRQLPAEIISDGTKLPIEQSRPKTTTDGRKLLFPALFDQPKNQNRVRGIGRARQRSAVVGTTGQYQFAAVASQRQSKNLRNTFFSPLAIESERPSTGFRDSHCGCRGRSPCPRKRETQAGFTFNQVYSPTVTPAARDNGARPEHWVQGSPLPEVAAVHEVIRADLGAELLRRPPR